MVHVTHIEPRPEDRSHLTPRTPIVHNNIQMPHDFSRCSWFTGWELKDIFKELSAA